MYNFDKTADTKFSATLLLLTLRYIAVYIHSCCHFIFFTNNYQEPDDLFETISQALLNAVDRDALSGWGAVVYIL